MVRKWRQLLLQTYLYSVFALKLMTQENVLINIWTKCSLLFNYIMSDRLTLQISLVVQLLAVVSLVVVTPVSQTVLEDKIKSCEMTASLTLWYSSSQLELKSCSQCEQSQCLCLIMWDWRCTGVGKLLSQTGQVTSSSSQSQSSSLRLTGSWRLKSQSGIL